MLVEEVDEIFDSHTIYLGTCGLNYILIFERLYGVGQLSNI